MTDRFALAIQALVTVVLVAFAASLYFVANSNSADTMGALIVGGVMAHWFKESSTIARRAVTGGDTVNVQGEDVTVTERNK